MGKKQLGDEFLDKNKLEKQDVLTKRKTGCLSALILVILLTALAVYIAKESEDFFDVDTKKEETDAKLGYEVGQSLEGISFEEIRNRWLEEGEKSSLKATEYLRSLVGEKVVWVGEVADVKSYTDGSGYVQVKIQEGFLLSNFSYIDFAKDSDYRNLNKGELIKLTGEIKSFNEENPTEPTLSPDFKNVTLEVINQ